VEIWHIKALNKMFLKFYQINLVPHLIQSKSICSKNRHLQPIAVSFVESGDSENKESVARGGCHLIHHHVLIAAKSDTAIRLDDLCGKNTLKGHFKYLGIRKNRKFESICTSDLKEITEPGIQLAYPSKSLWAYDEQYMQRFNYPPKELAI